MLFYVFKLFGIHIPASVSAYTLHLIDMYSCWAYHVSDESCAERWNDDNRNNIKQNYSKNYVHFVLIKIY